VAGGKLQEKTTDSNFKLWPSLQDYNEAIQNPHANLHDEVLKKGLPYTDAIGLPRAVNGAFASVYRMHCVEKDFALKLFLRNIEDQAERYGLISNFVQNDALPCAVTFDFLKQGIKTLGDWQPALKMEWVEGKAFDSYVIEIKSESEKLGELSESFVKMMSDLRFAGIAHGDLQHGNIIICDKELRLVDYDGIFVPGMEKLQSQELGHPNYQHPSRTEQHFGAYLDNFSAWVIYASLKGLQLDPRLLNQLGGGDDCLLFRRADFVNPLQSAAFAAFESHESEELQRLGRFLRAQLAQEIKQIPHLELPVPEIDDSRLAAIPATISTVKIGPRLVRFAPDDWLDKDYVGAVLEPKFETVAQPDSGENEKISWAIIDTPSEQSIWVKPTISGYPLQLMNCLHVNQKAQHFPPELAVSNLPGKIVFNKASGNNSPIANQYWIIIAPLMWLMVSCFYTSQTLDEDLRLHGVSYPATLTNVERHTSSYKTGSYQDEVLHLTFDVGGKTFTASKRGENDWGTYRRDDVYQIRALPSNPSVQEPFNEAPGTKQSADRYISWLCLLGIGIVELMIWFKPLWHRRLARKGIPVLATIEQLTDRPSGFLLLNRPEVTVSYKVGTRLYKKTFEINETERSKLVQGSQEVVLYDPAFPEHLVIHKFCMYKPVLTTVPPWTGPTTLAP
jgi:hypothetical protein